jgi:hypothetical protein
MNELIHLTPKQLRRAADLKERIDRLQSELTDILGAPAQDGDGAAPAKKRRFSSAAKARMRAAQKARWAKIKGTAPSATPARKAKRKMSAAARARMSALARARWRKAKAQGKTTL